MLLARTLEPIIHRVSAVFPVLLITGPRQVGKSTLLEQAAEAGRKIVSLDDLEQRALAQTDPALFLQLHKAPLIIDEIQYAPGLFNQIKIQVDRDKKPGQYWLTGSQKFSLMRGVSETLAGRIAILDLLGLSQAELAGRPSLQPFLPTMDCLAAAGEQVKGPTDILSLYQQIWLGSFPKLRLADSGLRDIFYDSYIQTYIQRDVRALTKVGDEMRFLRFLRAAAARTGQLINYADMARDVDVDLKTIQAWLSILETSGLIYLLQPYHTNVTKRLIKTPKLYFLDTGLCTYLTQWSSPEALEAGAMSGAILESYMLSELLKTYWHNGKEAHFYFYRDRDQREIDLLIEQDGTLYPVEFKKTASPSIGAAKHFLALEALGQAIGTGAILCLKQEAVALSRSLMAIPLYDI